MDNRLLKLLKEQIEKIGNLNTNEIRGPDYDIWNNTTSKIVRDLFGEEYLSLYRSQRPNRFSMVDQTFNQRQYVKELKDKKKFIEAAIEEYARLENDSITNIGRNSGLGNYDLHSAIKNVVHKKYEDRYYADAVESAFKEVIKRVKEYVNPKIGKELDGDGLMNHAFGCDGKEPIIKFNSLRTREEKDEQRGLMFLFKGIVGIRNRKVHENVILSDPYRALEYLALASLLIRLIEEHAK